MCEIARIVQTSFSIRRVVHNQANDGSPAPTHGRCCAGSELLAQASKQPPGSLAPALGGPDDAVMARNHGWKWSVPNGGYSVASSVRGSA
jgi:hypothetical protein